MDPLVVHVCTVLSAVEFFCHNKVLTVQNATAKSDGSAFLSAANPIACATVKIQSNETNISQTIQLKDFTWI